MMRSTVNLPSSTPSIIWSGTFPFQGKTAINIPANLSVSYTLGNGTGRSITTGSASEFCQVAGSDENGGPASPAARIYLWPEFRGGPLIGQFPTKSLLYYTYYLNSSLSTLVYATYTMTSSTVQVSPQTCIIPAISYGHTKTQGTGKP